MINSQVKRRANEKKRVVHPAHLSVQMSSIEEVLLYNWFKRTQWRQKVFSLKVFFFFLFPLWHFSHSCCHTSSWDPPADHIWLMLCIRVSLHEVMCPRHRVCWVMHCKVPSNAKQHRGSVGVRGDGDVDNEDALVSDAALQWDGGGLHLEAHKSRSVQSPPGEDDPPARLVPDAKHPAHHACLTWFLLKHGKRRALLQDAWLGERRQSYHVVIGWNARGKREQFVLQEQRGPSCGTVPKAGLVAGPWRINRK